jgi:hypothetical protein
MQPPGSIRKTSRLERRAEATTYQVDDLLAEVRDGRLRKPHFQRGMKWNDKDRTDFFDSLYRGFPIGTLLFWKHAFNAGEVSFGDLEIRAQPRADGLFIVDGQQRVTTLASALLVPRPTGARMILFDLETEEFRYGKIREAPPSLFRDTAEISTQIGVHELFDSSLLIKWVAHRMRDLPPLLVERALDCGKRLREYRVPVYVVDTGDEDVLRTIFDRTNRTGRRLDDTDVFTALFATIRPNDESTEVSLDHVARRIAQLGFGKLPADTILKALKAICNLPLDGDFTKGLEREDVPRALERTEAALNRTVLFLREDAHIPHSTLCPYELPIVALSRFFDLFPEPRTRNRILLRRWLWRGTLGGNLTGAIVSLRQHADAVRAPEADPATDAESASVQRLLKLAIGGPLTTASFKPFNFSTARSKLDLCALASMRPRDLRTDEAIDVASLFENDKLVLPSLVKRESDGLPKSVVNRLLHPPLSPADIAHALVRASPEVAASHGLTSEARTAFAEGRIDDFLTLRAERLTEIFDAFFRREAEIGADDSPPLDAIVVEEDAA